jgi:hypothetical protein
MSCIIRKALVLVIAVILCGAFVGCSEPAEKDTQQHGSGGGHHH